MIQGTPKQRKLGFRVYKLEHGAPWGQAKAFGPRGEPFGTSVLQNCHLVPPKSSSIRSTVGRLPCFLRCAIVTSRALHTTLLRCQRSNCSSPYLARFIGRSSVTVRLRELQTMPVTLPGRNDKKRGHIEQSTDQHKKRQVVKSKGSPFQQKGAVGRRRRGGVCGCKLYHIAWMLITACPHHAVLKDSCAAAPGRLGQCFSICFPC